VTQKQSWLTFLYQEGFDKVSIWPKLFQKCYKLLISKT